MSETEKYYVPDISEFHVGLECEYWGFDYIKSVGYSEKYTEGWVKHTICEFDYEIFRDGDKMLSNPFDDENKFRVKYLDLSDIESCGWRVIPNFSNYSIKTKDKLYELNPKASDGNLLIGEVLDRNTLFRGTIKNKSELKILMKQLGI